ncbi:MAG: glutathione peroxidase [Chitinophagales bacterium]
MGNISIYDFDLEAIDGEKINLSDFKGKHLLIVNTASECGYTPQYAQLQELWENFKDQVTVLGIPSNDFGGQEPGDEKAIREFCSTEFGVDFPLSKKMPVAGPKVHPLIEWLRDKSKNGIKDSNIKWNFHKFLISPKGDLISDYPSATEPSDEKILQHFHS